MDPANDIDAKLARRVAHELRALPPQRAPATLQARVFIELARRQALPWWQQNFRVWPLAARVGFAVVALAATRALFWVLAGPGVGGAVDAAQSAGQQFVHAVQAVISGFGALQWLTRDMLATVPTRLLTALMVAVLSSGALLLGSGTLVYRSLYSRP